MHEHEKINYVEFPAKNLEATKSFFETAFGWSFVDYGPEYAAFSDQGLDGGFFKSSLAASTDRGSALIVLYSERLEETQSKVEKAEGVLLSPSSLSRAGGAFTLQSRAGMSLPFWSEGGA